MKLQRRKFGLCWVESRT